MATPDQATTDRRVGRIFHLFHTFEEQRKAFGVLMRTGTPNWQLLANRDYMEWMLRHREQIRRLGAQARAQITEDAEAETELAKKLGFDE